MKLADQRLSPGSALPPHADAEHEMGGVSYKISVPRREQESAAGLTCHDWVGF